MAEPAQSIRTLLSEAHCLLQDCGPRDIKELHWCQHLNNYIGDTMTLSILTMWLFPELFLLFCFRQFHYPGHTFLSTFSIFPLIQLIGMVGEAMLTFYGRLITSFFRVLVCSSQNSDSLFVYRLMSLHYGLDILTTEIQ